MPRRRNPKGLYQRDGTWYCRFTVAGREYRRSLQTRDRAEAERRRNRYREQVIAEVRFGIVRHSWKKAVIAWANDTSGLKPSTRERYSTSLRMVDPILSGLDVQEIGRKELAKVAARKGIGNATRRRDLTAVMSVLCGAEARGWIEAVPDLGPILRNTRERHDPIVLPPEHEVAQLIANCPSSLGRMVQILRLTGMRLEEAAGLQHNQVDLARRVIQLHRTKTDRPRTVPLCDRAVGTISGTPRFLKEPWVFWHGEGKRYSNASSQLAAIRRRLSITWRTHDLRHLFAVKYLQGGGSIYDLQQILGHESIKTTERYLAYLTPEEQRRAKLHERT